MTLMRVMSARVDGVQVQVVTTSELRSWIFSNPKFFFPVNDKYCANLFFASAKAARRAFWSAPLRSKTSQAILLTLTSAIPERALSMAVRLVLPPMVSWRYWVACEPVIVQGLVLQLQVLQILMLEVEQFALGTPLALKAATIALIFTLRFCRARAAEAPFPTVEIEKMAIVGLTFTMALPETLKVLMTHWPVWAWQCMRSTATVTKTRSWLFILYNQYRKSVYARISRIAQTSKWMKRQRLCKGEGLGWEESDCELLFKKLTIFIRFAVELNIWLFLIF